MYLSGLNIGGFYSQSKEFNKEHLENFITEEDIERIYKWGFNLIRLPIDYFFFEHDQNPFNYLEDRLRLIDRFIEWTEKVFIEMKRILRFKGYFIIMIGNMRDRGVIDLESYISLQGSKYLTLWDKIIKMIRTWAPETKGSRMGLAQARAKEHNYSIPNHDTILVFRKD